MSEATTAAPAAPVTPAPAATPPAAAPIAETPSAEAPKPERTFSQAELDDIIEKRLAKERKKRDELKQERDVLRKLALERNDRQPDQQPAKPQATSEPVREQYATYEEYIEARADWRAEQKIESKLKERDEQNRRLSAEEKQKKAGEDFRKSMRESAKDIEDFDDVISSIKPGDAVANLNAEVLYAADNPGKMLHHLAVHPEEAERIALLPLGKQAREIVELEKKLAAPPVKPSKAPEPIKPVGGSKSAVGDEEPDPNKNGGKDWLAWRNRTMQAKRSGARA